MTKVSSVLRVLIVAFAALQAFAPGVASIVDARPAAIAETQAFTSHAESTDAEHLIRAHVDHCLLCQMAVGGAATPASPETDVPVARLHRTPAAATNLFPPGGQVWLAPTRAPPLG